MRALAADGHPVAKEQLRPEPHPGGPIVLVRDGKDVRGFLSLPAAMAAADDGDILEIRSDRPRDGADVPENRGAIALCAGPGYRPAIARFLTVGCGSSLAVEGLTFSTGSALASRWRDGVPVEKQGRISRLASCTFDGSGAYMVLAGGGGRETAGGIREAGDGSREDRPPVSPKHPSRVTRHPSRLSPARWSAAWCVGGST